MRDDSVAELAALVRGLKNLTLVQRYCEVVPLRALKATGSEKSNEGVMPTQTLDEFNHEISSCQKCSLGAARTNFVFGVGNPRADLVFVGEAPGKDEDLQGIPFVGQAGKLLTKIIEAIDLRREDVYICNVLKCRPPNNRNPQNDEIELCEPYLIRQLEIIQPKIICTLGTFSSQTLLKTKERIMNLRGNRYLYHDIPLIPTLHPAACLYNRDNKRYVWEDIQKVQKLLLEL